MPLKSTAQVRVDINARCLSVYPTEATRRTVTNLKTVGIGLSKDQPVHLARLLLVAAQDWEEIGITAYRLRPWKTDGTYQLTVTGRVP